MDDLLKQMGNRIYSRRKQLRLTQEELAEKAGITPQTVSSAELGKTLLFSIQRAIVYWKLLGHIGIKQNQIRHSTIWAIHGFHPHNCSAISAFFQHDKLSPINLTQQYFF